MRILLEYGRTEITPMDYCPTSCLNLPQVWAICSAARAFKKRGPLEGRILTRNFERTWKP